MRNGGGPPRCWTRSTPGAGRPPTLRAVRRAAPARRDRRGAGRRPKILILDEPLASLDLRNQREIVQLLDRLNEQLGVTILVVAHDLNPRCWVLSSAIYLLDGHAHFGTIGGVVEEDLLSHLYGTPSRSSAHRRASCT